MTAYAIFGAFLCAEMVLGYIGSMIGYTVNGVPVAVNNPFLDSVTFLGNMFTFSIDGIPYALSLIFVFMNIMMIFLVIRVVRGNS